MARTIAAHTRKDLTPTDYKPHKGVEALGIEVFVSPDGLSLIGFAGRSQKRAFGYRFKTTERRDSYLADWIASQEAKAAAKALAKAERNAPHSLKQGDVLYTSWGYDQTNVDFYQVTAVVGTHTVEVCEIAAEVIETEGMMAGKKVPLVGTFIGEAKRYRANARNTIRICSSCSASPLDFEEVAGVRVYRGQYFSTYA